MQTDRASEFVPQKNLPGPYGRGRVKPLKLLSSLINMKTLVTSCHTVWVHGNKNLGVLGPRPFDWGACLTRKKHTPPHIG